MKGEKAVTFPFMFKYSEAGTFQEEFVVTVRAPSLDQFSVHTAMVGYAAEAEKRNGADQVTMMAGIDPAAFARLVAIRNEGQEEAAADAPVTPVEETNDDMAARVIGTYAAGLGPDRFSVFMAFLLKTLKGNAKLATVGDTKISLTDAVMQSIADEGGIEAINAILATFAGFFLKDQPSTSKKSDGMSTPASPPLAAKVH